MVNLGKLNTAQRQAVERTQGPVLILAGAGTGKTRVITFRIAHLIAQRVAPRQILAVTFTNKAAREMQERVRELLGRPSSKQRKTASEELPTICTFHSFGVRVLRQHIERLGYKRSFTIFNEGEQLNAIKKVLSHVHGADARQDPAAVLSMLSRFRNGGSRAAVFAAPAVAAMAEHVRSRYEAGLQACNAVDFDDLILLPLKLFREHPDALEGYRERYRFVMVDEYQDTNAAQFELVHALTRQHRNLCVVGDDDQSIYGWRGAEAANLIDLEKHFPDVRVIKLEQNYRSTNTILRAANALIHQNARRRPKQLWSDKGAGSKITLHVCPSDEEEARAVVEEIECARQLRRVAWDRQAVLFRTNGQSRALEMAFRQASVRYRVVGGQSFFDRREIRDLLAYLKVCLNPYDDVSLLRIANVPARGLSDATMTRLLAASQEHKCSVYAAMGNPAVAGPWLSRIGESLRAFVAWLDRTQAALRSQSGLVLSRWADQFLTEIGYFEELRRSEKDAEAGENRVRNLKDLLTSMDSAPPASAPGHERLTEFLDDIMLDTEREEERQQESGGVTLITMHSCKGLEFPHVFIVGLEDGLLPHTRSKEEGTLDEERRLFYVALTRAMETVTLSYCLARRRYGQLMPCHPSPFLKELPADLVERAEDRPNVPVTVSDGKSLFAGLRAAIE